MTPSRSDRSTKAAPPSPHPPVDVILSWLLGIAASRTVPGGSPGSPPKPDRTRGPRS
jgi:hypothetical protein